MVTSRILFTAKQKDELWERWKNGQSVLANGCEQSQQSSALFDHLVGDREEIVGNLDTERLGGFEIDDKLELGRLLYR